MRDFYIKYGDLEMQKPVVSDPRRTKKLIIIALVKEPFEGDIHQRIGRCLVGGTYNRIAQQQPNYYRYDLSRLERISQRFERWKERGCE